MTGMPAADRLPPDVDITRLVAAYNRDLYGYAFRLSGSASDAEDLVAKAMHFYRSEDAQLGRRLSQHAAPARYPIRAHVFHGPQTTWRGVEVFPGRPAIAYDLQAFGAR